MNTIYLSVVLPPTVGVAFNELLAESKGSITRSKLGALLVEIGIENNPEALEYVRELAGMARIDRENALLGHYVTKLKRIAHNAGNLKQTLDLIDRSSLPKRDREEMEVIAEEFNELVNQTFPQLVKGFKRVRKRVAKRRKLKLKTRGRKKRKISKKTMLVAWLMKHQEEVIEDEKERWTRSDFIAMDEEELDKIKKGWKEGM